MASRMARCLHHGDRLASEGDRVALGDRPVYPGDLRGLLFRADDRQVQLLLQRKVRLDMVAMMMGDEEQVRFPARASDGLLDRRLLRRVDEERAAALIVMDKDAEIVAAADELLDAGGHR